MDTLRCNNVLRNAWIIQLACVFALASCATTINDHDSSKVEGREVLYVSEEELTAVEAIADHKYSEILNSSFSGNPNSISNLIKIRMDQRGFWDAAAGENFTDNFHKIILEVGDHKVAAILKREITSSSRKQWLDILFPYGDDLRRAERYKKAFPSIYELLSDK